MNWNRSYSSSGIGTVLALAAIFAGCSSASTASEATGAAQLAETAQPTEAALAQAYGVFKQVFVNAGEDQTFHIGFGYHPGLSTSKVMVDGDTVSGQVTIDFANHAVRANLVAPTENGAGFDLYFVKNAVGRGSVKPERGDAIVKIGSFVVEPRFGAHRFTLTADVGTAGVGFDLDMVVVTPKGKDPTRAIVATGSRTLFEKRFFRERAGLALDPVTGTLANDVETNDPLVRRGSELFFRETFGGNGRTCGTCHRAENNLTIDPAFVATLPPNDPLFIVPNGVEDASLLPHGLIRVNIDGNEQPTTKFVERSVPHTLAMSTSIGVVATGAGLNNAPTTGIDGPPPDQRTGWSGDGAPGRGTLQEFAFGALGQHFTMSLGRVAGVDFRLPTQEELDALEAFQLFSGRQKNVLTPILTFGDPAAQAGRDAVLNEGQCVACHRDIIGDPQLNFNFDTGVESLAISFRTLENMPKDSGFGVHHNDRSPGSLSTGFGNGRFNVAPLFEAADTGPFFHNNAITTIEDAVAFYTSAEFLASPGSGFARPNLTAERINDIAGFLRTINALTNIAQVRKRVQFLGANATPGGTAILEVAIADTSDAIDDLVAPALSAKATVDALQALRTLKQFLELSRPFANDRPTTTMIQAQAWLDIAEASLLPGNPNHDF
jgi:hypothetical protein